MKYTPRQQWSLRPRGWGSKGRKLPGLTGDKSGGVVLHYSAITARHLDHKAQCAERVRQHLRHHTESKGWIYLAYNWVVCPHGHIFEGRGWRARNAANRGENYRTLSVLWMGGPTDPVTPPAIKAIRRVLSAAFFRGWEEWVRGHGELGATSCPGPLQELIDDEQFGPASFTAEAVEVKAAGEPTTLAAPHSVTAYQRALLDRDYQLPKAGACGYWTPETTAATAKLLDEYDRMAVMTRAQ